MTYALGVLFLYPYLFFLRIGSPLPVFAFLIPILILINYRNFKDIKWRMEYTILAGAHLVLAGYSCFFLTKPQNDATYMILFWLMRLASLVYVIVFVEAFRSRLKWTSREFVNVFLLTFVAHALIAWVSFYFPPLSKFYFSIQHITELTKLSLEISEFTYRLPTFGALFFSSGVLYSICNLLVLLKFEQNPRDFKTWILLIFMILTGVAISRSLFIGIPFLCAYVIFSPKRKELFPYFLALTGVGVIIALGAAQIPSIRPIASWVAEPVLRYMDMGSLTSTSMDETFHSAQKVIENLEGRSDSETTEKIVPNSGQLFSKTASRYYGETDVGYLRLVLFGGYPFLIFFFVPSFLICIVTFLKSRNASLRLIIIGSFGIQMLSNVKGMIELSGIMLLIFIALISRDDSEHKALRV